MSRGHGRGHSPKPSQTQLALVFSIVALLSEASHMYAAGEFAVEMFHKLAELAHKEHGAAIIVITLAYRQVLG